jgi:hypothetical protein
MFLKLVHIKNVSCFEEMERLLVQEKLKNRAVALYLALHPVFDRTEAKQLDKLFVDDSVQTVWEFLSAVERRFVTPAEVKALYATNLWKNTSGFIHHFYLETISDALRGKRLDKVITALSGKNLEAQPWSNLYPLNIPKSHPLFDRYGRHRHSGYLEYSTFVQDGERENPMTEKESAQALQMRINQRAKFILGNFATILFLSADDLARRVEFLKDFETRHAEIKNDAYQLLLTVSPEHFEQLSQILLDNFLSLKNLKESKKEMDGYFRMFINLHPEIAGWKQSELVRWAAEKLGIVSVRHLHGLDAQEKIKNLFKFKLKENGLGLKIVQNEATQEERDYYLVLFNAHKLLSAIYKSIGYYRDWLAKIPDVEIDPKYMLPPASVIPPVVPPVAPPVAPLNFPSHLIP